MRLPLAAGIAWRYLRAKKSHSAVTAISVVAVCGIAVATAAIICVLSVFNGFKAVIADRLDTLAPDIMISAAKGKTISNPDSIITFLDSLPQVKTALPTILENALAIADGREVPVAIKGVDIERYCRLTALSSLLMDDVAGMDSVSPALAERLLVDLQSSGPDASVALFSIGAASRLGVYPDDKVLLFTPRREGTINIANPSTSFLTDSVNVSAVYRSNQSDYDEDRIIVDIDLARDLLQYDYESTDIEVAAVPGTDCARLAEEIASRLGSGFVVKDRLRQQETNFRMISIEKWITFLLLFFILLIASFNIISSLSMLVLEKQGSIATLRALGMNRKTIGNIFWWESLFVTLIGGGAGILIGLALCLLQQRFGFIHLQGNSDELLVSAYPVAVQPRDILITAIPVLLIGLGAAFITSLFAKSRTRE